jgi:zinc/manganese transport system substrate-binding protein
MRRITIAGTSVLAATLLLSGCSAGQPESDGGITVVASTNVYGDIAETIGGDRVQVTSIIDDPSQDPHSFEGTARDQLALSRAEIVIQNGGGYDEFIETLLSGADNADAVVIDAAEIAGLEDGHDEEGHEGEEQGEDEHAEDETADEHEGHHHDHSVNEHVWYDLHVVGHVAEEITEALAEAEPGSAELFQANLDEFLSGLEEVEGQQAALAETADGAGIITTEPVALYLLQDAGFVDRTPEEFSEAIEEEGDVPPLAMQQTLDLVASGTLAFLVYNEQTTGPSTEQVLNAADGAGLPVVAVDETLPEGLHYLEWMTSVLDDFAAALS